MGAWVDNQKKVCWTILSGCHPNKWMMKPRVEYLEKFPNWKWGKQQKENFNQNERYQKVCLY